MRGAFVAVLGLLALVIALGMAGLALHDAIAYPDATEMRRFLMRWPWYTSGTAVMFAVAYVLHRSRLTSIPRRRRKR